MTSRVQSTQQHLSEVQRECWSWLSTDTTTAPAVEMRTAMALASMVKYVYGGNTIKTPFLSMPVTTRSQRAAKSANTGRTSLRVLALEKRIAELEAYVHVLATLLSAALAADDDEDG